jgi:beta-glucanase (GH16 family)
MPNPTKWTSDTGAWPYNSELEYYTNATNPAASDYSTQNAFLDGSGDLVIQALRQNYGGRNYTSARLTTATTFTQAYGRFEASIQVPAGQGLWPAFWMLGDNINTVNWPNCGEIDIAEILGNATGTVYGSAHGPGYSGSSITNHYTLPSGQLLSNGFHTYAVQWSKSPAQILYSVDGHTYATVTPAQVPAGGTWEFNHPFNIILNLAVGGSWPGAPNASTPFPARMLVNYVRVYTHN